MPNLIISLICVIVLIVMGIMVGRDVSDKERLGGLVKGGEIKAYKFIGRALYALATIVIISVTLKAFSYEYIDTIYIMSLILWFMTVVIVVQLLKGNK